LSKTFKDDNNPSYDDKFKTEVENSTKEFTHEKQNNFQAIKDEKTINMNKLNQFIKNSKSTLSSGEDKVSNMLIKNSSYKFRQLFLHLFQTSFKTCTIPERWKHSVVKMIPKKENENRNPLNYRPISLTNCLTRLCERFILEMIHKHLKRERIIVKEQSGFRAKRQTKDNILAICQKSIESFNQKKEKLVFFL
jgi:hypothetical protein